MRAIWKGNISFALVSIPISVFSATRRNELSFHHLHKTDMSPVSYKRFCDAENVEVPWEEITRGYEYEKEQYVEITEEDIEKADVELTKTIQIMEFVNEDEIESLMLWAHGKGMDHTLIETMPMGEIDGDRTEQYLPLSIVRARLARRFTLEESAHRTGGPARYVRVGETGGRLGFITPLTHNFCESCNRVRLTCTGTLYMCLGQNDAADLRAPLRASADDALVIAAIDEAISRKPKGHDFVIDRRRKTPAVARHMSVTGG